MFQGCRLWGRSLAALRYVMGKRGGCRSEPDGTPGKGLVQPPSSTKNIAALLKGPAAASASAGGSAQVNMVQLLADLVHQGKLTAELQSATDYCSKHLTSQGRDAPMGLRSPLSTPTAVKERLVATPEVMFGGALGMLDFKTRAKPMDTMDLGRMRWACETLQHDLNIHKVLGMVAVQGENIKDDFVGLLRVDRDADIDAVLLAMYWHKDHAHVLSNLTSQSQDIVFSAQLAGQGLALTIERFVRMEQEEKQRAVTGQSAWRKAMDLKKIVELAEADRQGRTDAALAATLLAEKDSAMKESWNEDTCRRYLMVASRLDKPNQDIMVKWEFAFQRNTLVDSFTNIRAAATACQTPTEMIVLLETLYFEQSCKVRRAVAIKGRGHQNDTVNLFRGILLRNIFYKYCKQIFPKLADSIQHYGTWEWYQAEYGMSQSGLLQATVESDDEEDTETPQKPEQEGEMQTRYVSKQKLIALLDAVAKNKHEQAFTSLAKAFGNAGQLDMSHESMRVVRDKVNDIYQVYNNEFPPDTVQQDSLPEATVQVAQDQAGVYAPASVRTSSSIQSADEYNARLSQYIAECRRVESEAIQTYVAQRVVIKVARYESAAIESKLKQVRFMSEPGRKLFIYDSLCRDPLNWQSLKRMKRSYLVGAKVQMLLTQAGSDGGDTLAVVKNMYNAFATQRNTDNLSEDIVAATVPGTASDSPEHPSLVAAWKSLKALGNKHVGPKIGSVKMQTGELLQQIYTRGCWNRSPEHHIVFTYQATPQAPNSTQRKKMKYLSDAGAQADTYFNVWPVPLLPLASMPKMNAVDHENIFTEDTAQDSGAEDGSGGAAVEDLGEYLVPFPREYHHKFTQEMIHVWDIDVGVVLMPGSGQSLLAFIMENKRAVGIAKNTAHKKFIMKTLTDAVKTMGLAQHNPPPKPHELQAWENSQARAPPPKQPPPPQPVPKAVGPAPGPPALPSGTPPLPLGGPPRPPAGPGASTAWPKSAPISSSLQAFGQTLLR